MADVAAVTVVPIVAVIIVVAVVAFKAVIAVVAVVAAIVTAIETSGCGRRGRSDCYGCCSHHGGRSRHGYCSRARYNRVVVIIVVIVSCSRRGCRSRRGRRSYCSRST